MAGFERQSVADLPKFWAKMTKIEDVKQMKQLDILFLMG